MTLIKQLAKRTISAGSPIVSPFLRSGPLVLNYHAVGDPDRPFSISVDGFKSHIELVEESGYVVRTLSELVSNGFPESSVVFTFDDGDETQVENAARILDSKGLSGVFFLTTQWLGTSDYMSWKQARVLAENHEIGAHTRTHPDLAELSYDDLIDEIIDCKDELERGLATAVDHFAYPYGQEEHISETAISVAEEAGFKSISSTTGFLPGEIHSFNPRTPVLIERIPVDDAAPTEFEQLLTQENLGLNFVHAKLDPRHKPDSFYEKFRKQIR